MARPTRSEQRDRKVQPPRPPNAWILYRSYHFKLIRERNERLSQAAVSKIISEMWRRETDVVKREFEQQAEARKAQHAELYPDYRFCPKRREPKQSRKKSKSRDATPEDADRDEDDNDNAPPPSGPTVQAFSPVPYVHQPQPQMQPFVPGSHQNVIMPPSYLFHLMPESRYGLGGPSPPLSAAPSPAPQVGSQSSHRPSVASSSSTPSIRLSPSSESQASSRLSANSMPLSSLPNSHHPSPNPYAALPLSTPLFQNATSGELPLVSPPLQLHSTEDTVPNVVGPEVPVWNEFSTCLPIPEHSEELVNLDLAINQVQTLAVLQQATSPGPSFNSLQGLLSNTENGVFNLSNVECSGLTNQPQGDLQVGFGHQIPMVDYGDDIFADFDFDAFQREMDSLPHGGSSSVPVPSHPTQEDIQSLFHTPSNPVFQAYTTVRQRQSSAFTQDMMTFLDFEAAEDSAERTSPGVSPAPVTTVAPHQVRLQSPQGVPAIPIFTQMTNTPIIAPGPSYAPPAGAVNSSMRRVGGSWKPSFAIPHAQMDELIPTWHL